MMLVGLINKCDSWLNTFLLKNVDNLSIRLVKWIAFYYTDARVRKLYLKRLGFIMGEGSFSNLGLSFTCNDDYSPCVFVGNNVSIAPQVTFIANSEPNNSLVLIHNHYVKDKLVKKNGHIFVEDEVWIGANVTILPNVRLKRGSIIGAGSVVTKDTEEYCIYAGVPAVKIRDIKNMQEHY